jgi:lipoprotein-anchoring transpeptidase ErfK/SrfK
MASPRYTATGAPVQGSKGQSKAIRDEFTAIETAIDALNAIPLLAYAADVNTAGSFWIPTPGWAGTLTNLFAVNYVANTTTATVLTVEIGGSAVTLGGAWQFASTAAVGTQVTQTATAANTFTAGQPIEIISDGGGAPVMPAMLCALITRTS